MREDHMNGFDNYHLLKNLIHTIMINANFVLCGSVAGMINEGLVFTVIQIDCIGLL